MILVQFWYRSDTVLMLLRYWISSENTSVTGSGTLCVGSGNFWWCIYTSNHTTKTLCFDHFQFILSIIRIVTFCAVKVCSNLIQQTVCVLKANKRSSVTILEMMDDQDVFLRCNNLTLEQYRLIALARGLTGGAGCLVSLAVLVIVLLVAKKKTWENVCKRIYFAVILYTMFYCIVSIAAVNYKQHPTQESAWCAARGFLLHYAGTLVMVHFCVFAIAVMFQITVPLELGLCQGIKERLNISNKKAIFLEAFLFLILFFIPLLNTLEPLASLLPFYGNYGPMCWFRLELTENCTVSTADVFFLQAIPFAIMCFSCCMLTFMISLTTLCGLYLKFQKKRKLGSRIGTLIPTMLILTVITFVMTGWFIVSAVTAKNFSNSFSDWLREATVTLAATVGILVATGIYIHFPTHLCDLCKRAHQARLDSAVSRRQVLQIQVDHHNSPVHSRIPAGHTPNLKQPSNTPNVRQPTHIRSQPSPAGSLIVHKSVRPTTQKSSRGAHSLPTHIQSQPSHTECRISHEPVTTTQQPSQTSYTECRISHEPVTTTQDCTETTPLISHKK